LSAWTRPAFWGSSVLPSEVSFSSLNPCSNTSWTVTNWYDTPRSDHKWTEISSLDYPPITYWTVPLILDHLISLEN
jgi:hypothetical protein